MKRTLNIIGIIILIVVLFSLVTLAAYSVNGQTAPDEITQLSADKPQLTGGQYSVQRSVVAGGGNPKQQNNVAEHGTTGQPLAGHDLSGGLFRIYSGFWSPDDFAPPAASGKISGRVLTDDGAGLKSSIVKLTAPDGSSRTAISSNFGYYQFDNVEFGKTYKLTVASKRFRFNVQTVSLAGSLTEFDLTGEQ